MQYEATSLVWRASSYSSGNGQCVEVTTVGGTVPVRDSKVTSGPVLVFGVDTWSAFVTGVREGGHGAAS
ncbi:MULTISPECIES: DUF397 domain-containing protein [unclassified Streptomyces]|uniref:DUF397 domain-containing protein n=1 Tax=Streptomyces sp. AC1-42W TaxID=2218666 RepID=UPI000DADD2E1|nr:MULTISPECIES: DUF397 domain-containing protein [unclassified Streptomyces]PZT75398.1 DUF397 domain-containing protein [Streptomyces sp. AC1-42T]PZT83828.1 DUF397 domain-containing protein [Streptomyces sp. AC1-42W]